MPLKTRQLRKEKKIMWLLYFRQLLLRFPKMSPKPGVYFLGFWRYELWGGNWWVLVPAMPERGDLPRFPGELLLLVHSGLPRGPLRHQHRRVLQPALPPRGTLHGWGQRVRLPALGRAEPGAPGTCPCTWERYGSLPGLVAHFLPNSRFHSLILHEFQFRFENY